MNKKGESAFDVARKSIYWMIAGVVITMIALAVGGIMAGYLNSLTSVPPKLQAEALAYRFLHSADCLAYQDAETGRVYSNVIDANKFTGEQFSSCYTTESRKEINFGLTLKNAAKTIVTNNYFKTDRFNVTRTVLVWDGTQFTKDTLEMGVQEKI
ncbi:MAG TPA: hypothetical protein VJC21_02765 [Candidatus Nanoarchaeia archaeon]|nr:hypothetical protein [Candidatus Nanoarchaeia archaeon]